MGKACVAAKMLIDDWQVVMSYLPTGWREQAKRCGAMQRMRAFAAPEAALRTLLIYLGEGCSLIETAVRAGEGCVARVSPVAVMKLLRRSEGWLHWIASALSASDRNVSLPSSAAARRVCLVDATTVSEPGSTGTDWRVHYALDLRTLQCLFFELTDAHGAEKLSRFPVKRGDLVLGDRIYATPAGLAHLRRCGADGLVRMTATNLPLQALSGRDFDLFAHLREVKVGHPVDWLVRVPYDDGEAIEGRICALRRTKVAAALAEKKLRRRCSRRGIPLGAEALEATRYVFVFTTLPTDDYPAAAAMELYRGRWQIEMCFKRFKSVLDLGHLPNQNAESARAWLYGKLAVSFLVERLVEDAHSFSPWGYPLPEAKEDASGLH
jgi:hypothetical protein